MFTKILAAIEDLRQSQLVLDLVRKIAEPGRSEVHIVHFRLRELSGYRWYARESASEAMLVADAAVFDLRMEGIAAGAEVHDAYVDRVGQAILAEAKEIGADLIVLGRARRGELLTRLLGDTTLRVERRAACPVILVPRRVGQSVRAATSGASAPSRPS
jgi:nucleotide-binding universal stress UspA family protein